MANSDKKQTHLTSEQISAQKAKQDALKDIRESVKKEETTMATKVTKAPKQGVEETVNPAKAIAEKRAEVKLLAPNQRTAGGQIFNLKIGAIITLKEAGIKDAGLAMRPIDKQNLESLILADDSAIPPIRVQNTDKGYVLIDGGHRLARAINLARIRYNKVTLEDSVPDLIAALNTLPEEISNEENTFIESQTIRCVAEDYKSTKEMIQGCFMANLALGKAAGKEHRCRYAVWMYDTALAEGRSISYREAGRRAGVSHAAINHYLHAKKRLEENGTADNPEIIERQKADKDDKTATALVKAMRDLYPSLTAMTMSDAVTFLVGFCKTDDMGMLAGFRNILQQVEVELASRLDALDNDDDDDDDDDQ